MSIFSLPHDPAILYKGNDRLLTTITEYVDIVVPYDGWTLWKKNKKAVYKSLSRQAEACAKILLTPAGLENDSFATRNLKIAIWDTVKDSPHVFYANESEKKPRFIFALGKNLNKHDFDKKGRLAVVAETDLAFPLDPGSHAYFLPRRTQRPSDYRPYSWEPAPLLPIKKTCFEPVWEACSAKNASDALGKSVKPAVIVWCLEHMESKPGSPPLENGRCSIPLSSTKEEDRTFVREKHYSSVEGVRKDAVDECIAKWGNVISPQTIRDFFDRQSLTDKFDKDGAQISVHWTNVHHNTPVFWGGGNDVRTYMDRWTHLEVIHRDFDFTQRLVYETLGRFNEHFYETEALRKDLLFHPRLVKVLNRIPHVRVEDGIINVAILWLQDKYFVPSLTHFEFQHGSVYGPDDEKGAEETSSRRTAFFHNPFGTSLPTARC